MGLEQPQTRKGHHILLRGYRPLTLHALSPRAQPPHPLQGDGPRAAPGSFSTEPCLVSTKTSLFQSER